MSVLPILLSAVLCVLGAAAEPASGAFELVYSYPSGTELGEPDLRQAKEVWPELFDSARESIDLAQFYIAHSTGEALEPALAALRRAGERGVRIRFILEKKFESQSAEGIPLLRAIPNLELRILDWSRVHGDGIHHAKYFVVDGARAYLGSQNFDWRSLEHIHELGLRVADPAVVAQIASVFARDWAAAADPAAAPARLERPAADYAPAAYLVASPWSRNPDGVGDSEAELVRLIGSAKSELLVQVMGYKPLSRGKPPRFYPPIDNALRDAAARGVQVRLLVAHWSAEEPGSDHLKSLEVLPNLEVRIATVPPAARGYIPYARVAHSKYMVVDGATLWVGTSNWEGGYLDNSRNLELVLRDPALAARAARIHRRLWDWAHTEPVRVDKSYARTQR